MLNDFWDRSSQKCSHQRSAPPLSKDWSMFSCIGKYRRGVNLLVLFEKEEKGEIV